MVRCGEGAGGAVGGGVMVFGVELCVCVCGSVGVWGYRVLVKDDYCRYSLFGTMRGLQMVFVFFLGIAGATLLLGAAAGGPPPPTCSCTEQLSISPCVEGESFGCIHDGTMWVAVGCRGVFTCNGITGVECSVDTDPPRNHSCKCRSAPSPSPAPPLRFPSLC